MSGSELMEWHVVLEGGQVEVPSVATSGLGPDELFETLTRTFGGGA